MSAVQQRRVLEAIESAGPAETLPAWTYNSAEFFELERQHLLLANWQIVGHVSELRQPGDFVTLTLVGERALAVRDEDGELHAFYNVCRHRAAAVVNGAGGNCGHAVRCPYHGWTYGLDGRLKAIPGEANFPNLDKSAFGLRRLDLEVWQGFVFVRFRSGGPSVAERMAPFAEELSDYRFADMEPLQGQRWVGEVDVDWKNVMDNFLEGYHVPVGHPGLYRLFGSRYEVETQPGDVSRAMHWMRDKPSSNWSERHYQNLLPVIEHLPADRRRAWTYYALLPNQAFDVYPDRMDYFQILPTGPGKTKMRGRSYGLPGTGRELRAARFLNRRVNHAVYLEDNDLITSVQVGLGSESYVAGILPEKENGVRQLHDMVRRVLPVARLRTPPAPGNVVAMN
ncbi:MAG: aromatic ring-hydroxylating oxygenase subunit alpha, partial [Methylocella sp.]